MIQVLLIRNICLGLESELGNEPSFCLYGSQKSQGGSETSKRANSFYPSDGSLVMSENGRSTALETSRHCNVISKLFLEAQPRVCFCSLPNDLGMCLIACDKSIFLKQLAWSLFLAMELLPYWYQYSRESCGGASGDGSLICLDVKVERVCCLQNMGLPVFICVSSLMKKIHDKLRV